MKTLKHFCTVIAFMMTIILPTTAQNLTASQLNIYFGSPKKATVTNSQGTIIAEFDRNGRVTKVTQGNMSFKYDWSTDGKEVTVSMYQGANFQDSGLINVLENSPSRLKYVIGDMATMDISFKNNGAVEKIQMSNPQGNGTMTYFYDNASDVFPYAIEMSTGVQSAKISVTIDKTDSYGNPTAYTQEIMGQKEVTKMIIEYY